MAHKPPNLTGRRFGKLLVLEPCPVRKFHWRCQCDCGSTPSISTSNLILGRSESCGCVRRLLNKDHPKWKGYGELSGQHWAHIKLQAKKRRLRFAITIKAAWELFEKQNRCCALSGRSLVFRKGSRSTDTTASLDRIDSSKGYVPGNLQWIHKRLQRMKSDFEPSEFIEWCRAIATHRDISDMADGTVRLELAMGGIEE